MRSTFLMCTMHSRNRNSTEGMGFIVSTQLRLTREAKKKEKREGKNTASLTTNQELSTFDAGTNVVKKTNEINSNLKG